MTPAGLSAPAAPAPTPLRKDTTHGRHRPHRHRGPPSEAAGRCRRRGGRTPAGPVAQLPGPLRPGGRHRLRRRLGRCRPPARQPRTARPARAAARRRGRRSAPARPDALARPRGARPDPGRRGQRAHRSRGGVSRTGASPRLRNPPSPARRPQHRRLPLDPRSDPLARSSAAAADGGDRGRPRPRRRDPRRARGGRSLLRPLRPHPLGRLPRARTRPRPSRHSGRSSASRVPPARSPASWPGDRSSSQWRPRPTSSPSTPT